MAHVGRIEGGCIHTYAKIKMISTQSTTKDHASETRNHHSLRVIMDRSVERRDGRA
jgi:hypothetical protein